MIASGLHRVWLQVIHLLSLQIIITFMRTEHLFLLHRIGYEPLPSAGRHTLILPLNTSLGRWTDHAARTGKCSLPASSACEPSVPEFPLTLGHTRTGPRTANSLRASLMRGRESCYILPLSEFVVAGPGSA